MKPQTNQPSPTGRARYKRLVVWQAAHKQLLHDDAQYQKRHTFFVITLVCLSCIMLPFYLPFFGIRLFGFGVDVSIISCVAAMIVCLAVRQFQLQNHRIQSYLQSSQHQA